jgi:hypothetical protein
MKGQHYVYMDDASGAGGGAAAGPAGAPAPAGASAPGAGAAPAAGVPATAGAAPGNSEGGSALAAGAGGEAPAVHVPGWGFIPEKFQVKGSTGEIDAEASARKLEEHRGSLEKRMGEVGARPKAHTEYKLPELPEALKGAALDDAAMGKFKEKAHKAGFSQAQFELAMGEYFAFAPQLVDAGKKVSADETVASLKTAWGNDYSANAGHAWRGVTQLAKDAGLSVDEIEAELGNSPAFNRIMAAVGKQMREDKSVNTSGALPGGSDEAEAAKIQMSEEFQNPKHPGHKAATARWSEIVTRGIPADQPAM